MFLASGNLENLDEPRFARVSVGIFTLGSEVYWDFLRFGLGPPALSMRRTHAPGDSGDLGDTDFLKYLL